MAKVSKRTFSLPPECDAAVERWLKEEVVPTYDAVKADPSRGIPAKSVFAEARARSGRRKARR